MQNHQTTDWNEYPERERWRRVTDDGGRSKKEENGMRDEARGGEGDEKQEE